MSSFSIAPVRQIPLPDTIGPQTEAGKPGAFQAALDGAIHNVEQTRSEAAQAVENFLSGEGGELHSTILATQRAELAFELFLQTRNKVVQAYQEIMRMQV